MQMLPVKFWRSLEVHPIRQWPRRKKRPRQKRTDSLIIPSLNLFCQWVTMSLDVWVLRLFSSCEIPKLTPVTQAFCAHRAISACVR
ncbi:hypothetical protein CDAR_275011 [Caerostris darwini]|uniref:Uncharacterized protein n=1 Tax=Caerostris darwini TaxID=1538125 RepID=A0AAV4UF12_9ARAC|nr:hypothetical protein CDAR_275011 [Caerostris darwini]